MLLLSVSSSVQQDMWWSHPCNLYVKGYWPFKKINKKSVSQGNTRNRGALKPQNIIGH